MPFDPLNDMPGASVQLDARLDESVSNSLPEPNRTLPAPLLVTSISAPSQAVQNFATGIPIEPVRGESKQATQPRLKDTSSDTPLPEAAVVDSSTVYEGDRLDLEGPLKSNKSGRWETIDFSSPLELIYFFNPHLNEENAKQALHLWQIETSEQLAAAKPTDQTPYRFCLCAANGSGKDAYVIAPFVIWFALTKIRSLTIITSSSGVQLTAQTENYIASLARTVNSFFGEPIFKVTRRFIKCLKSGSEIRLFATDEAGKAEGYHPFPDHPGAEMAIIVNEAKSVQPEIFGALSRCTGYNYLLYVSTPGEPVGDFHDAFLHWSHTRRVTAFDCPHIPLDHINEIKRKYGEMSAIYRSQVLALFTTVGGQVVIDQDHLNKCIDLSLKGIIQPKKFGKVKIGLDASAGRDEFGCTGVHGNVIAYKLYFIEVDTTIAEEKVARWLDHIIAVHGVDQVEINGDDGGVGHAILDHLIKRGYKINRVLNQSRAMDFKQYANRGTELWYNLRRIVEECLIYLPLKTTHDPEDRKLYDQLSLRHFKNSQVSGRLTLASKKEEKSNGISSPDRADSLTLALAFTHFDDIQKEINAVKAKARGLTAEELHESMWGDAMAYFNGQGKVKEQVRGNSLEHLMRIKEQSAQYN